MKNSLPLFLAFACLLCSCVDPLEMLPDGSRSLPSNSLVISPSVLGATIATKTAGVDELGENTINTLDVYVYEKTVNGSEITLTFFKRYHFTKNSTTLSSGTDVLLESNWRNEPVATRYSPSKKYRIYAIANSRHSATEREKNLTWDELMALNFTSPQTVEISGKKYGYDIIRLKGEVPSPADNQDLHIAEKDFVMDGMVDDWQIVDSSEPQYITEYPNSTSEKYRHFELKRAAAKFHVTLTFGDFINSKADPDDPNNPNKRIVTKLWWPSFKFSNFMISSHDVKPSDTYPDPEFRDAHLWNSDDRFNFTTETPINDPAPNPEQRYTYELTTYSYAFNWKDKEEGADVSPSLLFSMGYSSYKQEREDAESEWVTVAGSETDTEFHYYRIPLIDLDTYSAVDRNTYYQVTAQINSKGAKTVDTEEPTDVFLMYKVIPWPANPNEVTDANTTQLQYFVAETRYRLRGDGLKSVDLQYFTPKSNKEGDHFLAEPKITKVRVYYVDQTGAEKPFNDQWEASKEGDEYVWSEGKYIWTGTSSGVSITVVPNQDGAGGVFHVTSTSLESRAVKYITFTAVVDYDFDNHGPQLKQEIVVTHFPLDNIQSIQGYWSTKNATTESSTTGGNGWIQVDEYKDYIDYNTWNNYRNNSSYYRVEESSSTPYITLYFDDGTPVSAYYFYYYYPAENDSFNSGNFYYWVTRTGGIFGGYTYTYHRAYYYHLTTGYYRLVDDDTWVNWDNHTGSKWEDNNFTAAFWGPYYNQSGQYVYNMTSNSTGTGANSDNNRLTNNHIYIIQISKAEEGVILGRPKIENYQSQDNVVSPAFMIASQLGAVRTFKDNSNPGMEAAMHCASYVEVTRYQVNGSWVSRRFEGWRLPTAAEIDYIIKYQGNQSAAVQAGVFQDVLTGGHYYTLDGGAAATNYTTDDFYAVRCIRDLTPEEVVELNNDGKITNASL